MNKSTELEMTISKALKQCYGERKITQAEIAYRLGVTTATVSLVNKKNNISLKSLIDMLNIMDYELVLRDKNGQEKCVLVNPEKEQKEEAV